MPSRRWLPVAAWAAVIFTFSTGAFGGQQTGAFLLPWLERLLPGVPHEHLLAVHGAIRKLAHFSEYAVLSWLAYRALRADGRSPADACRLAILGATLYAATDEFHQLFVPNRTAAVGDVVVDAIGATAAQMWIVMWRRLRSRRRAAA